MEMGEIVIQNVNQVYHNANQEILMRFRTSTSTFVKVKVLLLREKADREKARWQDF